MTRDIIEINNFIVCIEQSNAEKTIIEECGFDNEAIGFAFYGSGNVDLEINYERRKKRYNNTKGTAFSFYCNDKVNFAHTISHNNPLQCISIFSKIGNMENLPEPEGEIYSEHFSQLINPRSDFVEGPNINMTPDMQNAVYKILTTDYTGSTRLMFIKSQVTELLSHFFGTLIENPKEGIKKEDQDKLYYAKEIISKNIEAPPTLNELSKLIGLNNYKLKKNFKELFGVPVFKYLQNERLNKAYNLLSETEMSIQQTAFSVGYESLSSFSNAFINKFGFRPSEIKK
jgi:AraC-like DNA-binding protein